MPQVEHLLEQIKPEKYELSLNLDEKELKFSGSVVISVEALVELSQIKLHAHDLKVSKALVADEEVLDVSYDRNAQYVVLTLTDKVQPGDKFDIELDYCGTITESMVGIYPSRFKLDGKEELIISTQLESHHGREVFPSIDEPAAKAVFELTLETKAGIEVISNTPAVEQTEESGRMTTSFAPTPKMSTYLLAFVAGNIQHKSAETNRGVEVKVWSTPDKIEQTDLALDSAVRSLELLEDFFGIEYPLEKCDLVAVPDFSAGAMENWGLCTFRETALLFDERTSGLENRKYVVAVVAHELAHQWFGNLVTMQWWTDLWLNEGFARWMETYIPDKLYPEWELWEDFISGDMNAAQSLDMLANSHPVEMLIENPEDIRSIFDAISYDKGASVIRMLEAYVGEAAFRKGLAIYMDRHAYANASTADLWKAIAQSSGKDIEGFMDSWTKQQGFPVVDVALEGGKYKLSQKQYLLDESSKDLLWPIPLNSSTKDIMQNIEATVVVDELSLPVNKSHGSFYVSNYSSELLDSLFADNTFSKLEVKEQIGLIHDASLLNKKGVMPIDRVLEIMKTYRSSRSISAWTEVAIILKALKTRYSGRKELIDQINDYTRELVSELYEELGWEPKQNEDVNTPTLREMIISLACSAELPDAVKRSQLLFDEYKNLEDLDPQIRDSVIRTAVRHGDTSVHSRVLKHYYNVTNAHVKTSFVRSLTASRDKVAIETNFDLILSDSVKLQDTYMWIGGLFANSETRERAWSWLKQNWAELRKRYGTDVSMASSMPMILGYYISSADMLVDFNKFMNVTDTKYLEKKIEQARERIQHRVAWSERDEQPLREYFGLEA